MQCGSGKGRETVSERERERERAGETRVQGKAGSKLYVSSAKPRTLFETISYRSREVRKNKGLRSRRTKTRLRNE